MICIYIFPAKSAKTKENKTKPPTNKDIDGVGENEIERIKFKCYKKVKNAIGLLPG